jgi:glycerol-3-phosphate acyltransferase PlsY
MTPLRELFLASAWGYLLGSVPTGVLVCRVMRAPDPRQEGSGHTGGLNVGRSAGFLGGALTTVVDFLLGAGAVTAALLLTGNPWAATAAGAMAVAGHNWSVFLRFEGGIGLSTLLGAMLAFAPLTAAGAFLVLLSLWLVMVKLLRIHRARATIVAMVAVGPVLWLLGMPWPGVVMGALGGLVVIVKTLPDWTRKYD